MHIQVIDLLNKFLVIEYDIDLHEDLFLKGFTSMLWINFIVDLETRYEMEVLTEDLILDNFSTVQKIIDYISKHSHLKVS